MIMRIKVYRIVIRISQALLNGRSAHLLFTVMERVGNSSFTVYYYATYSTQQSVVVVSETSHLCFISFLRFYVSERPTCSHYSVTEKHQTQQIRELKAFSSLLLLTLLNWNPVKSNHYGLKRFSAPTATIMNFSSISLQLPQMYMSYTAVCQRSSSSVSFFFLSFRLSTS